MRRRTVILFSLLGCIAGIFLFAAAVVFRFGSDIVGASPSGSRLARFLQSPNFKGGKFVNCEPTSTIIAGGYWKVLKQHLESGGDREPSAPIPAVVPDFENFSNGPGLKAVWLGHSTVLAAIDSVTLLLDPVFDDRVDVILGSKERFWPPVLARQDLPNIDAIVISHDHYDHLEKSTVDYFAPLGTLFFVPLGIGAHLAEWKVADSQIIELDWWESMNIDSVKLVCTPARHFSGRSLLSLNQTLWATWSIIGPRHRFYFGGDTGLTDQFKEIGLRYGPFDLTILPIGAYGDAWPGIHLTPEEAIQAHSMLRGDVLLPVHWGTFDIAFHPWDEPIRRFFEAGGREVVRITTPLPGDIVDIDSGYSQQEWWRERP